jgi:hypothetical protein
MLDLQHQYNNCTTIPHMRVGLTYWGPPSCEGLLYNCCISVVQESNPLSHGVGFTHWTPPPCEEVLCNYCGGVVNPSFFISEYTLTTNGSEFNCMPSISSLDRHGLNNNNNRRKIYVFFLLLLCFSKINISFKIIIKLKLIAIYYEFNDNFK